MTTFTDDEIALIYKEFERRSWKARDFYQNFEEAVPHLCSPSGGWRSNIGKIISKTPGRRGKVQGYQRTALAAAFGWTPEEFDQYLVSKVRPLGTATKARSVKESDTSPNAERHAYPETRRLASQTTLDSLDLRQNYSLFAVDDGVMLYHPPGFRDLDLRTIRVKSNDCSSIETFLNNPKEADLLRAIKFVKSDSVKGYLKALAKGGARGKYQTKIGLTGFEYPVSRIGQPLILHVAPISYWITRTFNRAMLIKPNDALLALRETSLDEILPTKESVTISCPSQFFVEVSLVTADNKLVILEKNSNVSALAKSGKRWTCSVEEGLVWSKDMGERTIDFRGAVERGVQAELKITRQEIESVVFFGIALEHTHLNTALLGMVKLLISSENLVSRIANSPDFGSGHCFVDIGTSFTEPFTKLNGGFPSWHPTARMRALLSLYHRFGRDRCLESFKWK